MLKESTLNLIKNKCSCGLVFMEHLYFQRFNKKLIMLTSVNIESITNYPLKVQFVQISVKKKGLWPTTIMFLFYIYFCH